MWCRAIRLHCCIITYFLTHICEFVLLNTSPRIAFCVDYNTGLPVHASSGWLQPQLHHEEGRWQMLAFISKSIPCICTAWTYVLQKPICYCWTPVGHRTCQHCGLEMLNHWIVLRAWMWRKYSFQISCRWGATLILQDLARSKTFHHTEFGNIP